MKTLVRRSSQIMPFPQWMAATSKTTRPPTSPDFADFLAQGTVKEDITTCRPAAHHHLEDHLHLRLEPLEAMPSRLPRQPEGRVSQGRPTSTTSLRSEMFSHSLQ